MKRTVLTLFIAPLLFVLIPILGCSRASAQVAPAPSLMNFQGRLTRPDGTPVANGNYSIRFSLWNVASGGTAAANEKWNQTVNPVAVRNGTFAVLLNVASPANLFDTNLWLEIKIGTAAPLTPRQQVVSVAFAMKANTVPDNAITSAKIANGTITGADIANGTITADKLATGAGGWLLSGNAGTTTSHFLGTTDNKPLILKANNRQVMRYRDVVNAGNTFHAVNVLGGAAINIIQAGVLGATIAGGGQDNNTGTDLPNEIWGNFGTIGGGSGNFIDAFTFAAIGGGEGNIVQGNHAVIGGGSSNNVQSADSVIGGGSGNYLFGQYGTIAGGQTNQVTASWAAIGGGFNNLASGQNAVIGGGLGNTASHQLTTVGGGYRNISSAPYATIGGGSDNSAKQEFDTVAGGYFNEADGPTATVSGGSGNHARGSYATVAGGYSNDAIYNYPTVGGGFRNLAFADYATVPGGYRNYAGGAGSFAAGVRASANHSGAFVWADNRDAEFSSTGPYQFCIRAYGGVMLETGQDAFLFTSSTAGEKNRYFDLYNSPQTQTASGLKAGGILCADSFAYANPGKNDLIVKGTLAVGYNFSPTNYTMAVNGSIYALNGYSSSDARYKKDIITLDYALDKILNLRGVNFEWNKEAWKEQNFPEGRQVGFIAQEVEKVLPELVSTDDKGYKSVAYANVVPVLVEAMKQQQKQIVGQQKQIEELKAVKQENNDLKAALTALLQRVERIEADAIRK